MGHKTTEEIQKNRKARRDLVDNYKLDRDALEKEYVRQMRELAPVRHMPWNRKPKLRL